MLTRWRGRSGTYNTCLAVPCAFAICVQHALGRLQCPPVRIIIRHLRLCEGIDVDVRSCDKELHLLQIPCDENIVTVHSSA